MIQNVISKKMIGTVYIFDDGFFYCCPTGTLKKVEYQTKLASITLPSPTVESSVI